MLKYTSVIDDLIEYRSLCCNNNYQKNFDENLKKRFVNTCKFSNNDTNNFSLLLRTGEHMNM